MFQSGNTGLLRASLQALGGRPKVPTVGDGLRLYPSGRLSLLIGIEGKVPTTYRFALAPGPLRTGTEPHRTASSLHHMSFRFAAERVEARVVHDKGGYTVELDPVGDGPARDFSFTIQTWHPPPRTISVRSGGVPLPGLRKLTYGGSDEDGDLYRIVTNYDATELEIVSIPYSVDTRGESVGCGYWLFLKGIDPTRIETLVISGGHDQVWHGETSGELRVPRGVLADTVVLFSEPHCSGHVPQPGDRYAVAVGPFEPEHPLVLSLDHRWE